jgi:hypothetical protein
MMDIHFADAAGQRSNKWKDEQPSCEVGQDAETLFSWASDSLLLSHSERCWMIQSASARSNPTSWPARSGSGHLCFSQSLAWSGTFVSSDITANKAGLDSRFALTTHSQKLQRVPSLIEPTLFHSGKHRAYRPQFVLRVRISTVFGALISRTTCENHTPAQWYRTIVQA